MNSNVNALVDRIFQKTGLADKPLHTQIAYVEELVRDKMKAALATDEQVERFLAYKRKTIGGDDNKYLRSLYAETTFFVPEDEPNTLLQGKQYDNPADAYDATVEAISVIPQLALTTPSRSQSSEQGGSYRVETESCSGASSDSRSLPLRGLCAPCGLNP